jgi:hypothetical protein
MLYFLLLHKLSTEFFLTYYTKPAGCWISFGRSGVPTGLNNIPILLAGRLLPGPVLPGLSLDLPDALDKD